MMKRIRYFLRMSALYVLIGMIAFIVMLSGMLDKAWEYVCARRDKFAFYSVLFVSCGMLSMCSYRSGFEAAERQIQAFSDTVIVTHVEYDTIIMEKPVPVTVTKYKTIHDTLLIHDTQEPVVVDVPIDQWHFRQDSIYDLWLEGAYVNVDSIAVYPKTIYHDRIISMKPKKKHWSLGPQIGYGINGPYVGVGVQYNLISW